MEEAAAAALGVTSVNHRSALRPLRLPAGVDLAAVVHHVVAANWNTAQAGNNKERSRQNWRWSLQTQIGAANASPEVTLERAVAAACARAGRDDWANQIPVCSGLVAGRRETRRAVDLAHRRADGGYELIELKIASDTPLRAAIELLGYACLWLLSRADPPSTKPALLTADKLCLRVLAPAAYYARFDLQALEALIDHGARALGAAARSEMTFGFDVLPEELHSNPLPEDGALLATLGARHKLHA